MILYYLGSACSGDSGFFRAHGKSRKGREELGGYFRNWVKEVSARLFVASDTSKFIPRKVTLGDAFVYELHGAPCL